jgi:hypothetical protein
MTNGTPDDPRWGGCVPWSLRHSGVELSGDMDRWLELVAQRLERFIVYNEAGVQNISYFADCLVTATLGDFQFDGRKAFGVQRLQRLSRRPGPSSMLSVPQPDELVEAIAKEKRTRQSRLRSHRHKRIRERIATLEALFRLAQGQGENKKFGVPTLVDDLLRFCALAAVPLDIRGKPPLIVFMEEPLLQQRVVAPLLSRLQARWPERAGELVRAYHDMLAAKPFDEVFASAFKTLEEIARSVTGDPGFAFSQRDMQRWFPDLHSTIHATIEKLRAHRGDEGAHGRKAPDAIEIRYLLFSVCNIALLILDYEAAHSVSQAAQ